jgi:hypothetical protein
MTSQKNPDGTVNYFAQHAGKQSNFVSPKGKASGGRKNVVGPGPRPGNKQPPSAVSDFLLQAEQSQEQKRH